MSKRIGSLSLISQMRVGMPLEYIGFHLCVCFFPWYILSGMGIQSSNTLYFQFRHKKEAIDIEL